MQFAAAALILCLIPPQDAQKSRDPDVRRVTLKTDQWPLGKVVAELQKQSDIPIEYDSDVKKDLEKDDETVSIQLADIVLTGALRLIFGPHGYKVVVIDKKKVLIAKQ